MFVPDFGSRIRLFFIPDPGCYLFPSRIRIVSIPDPNCFHPVSRIRTKEFNPKNGFYALGNMIRVVHPGSGSWLFTYPGSRGQKGTGSRIRIPQHCAPGTKRTLWSVTITLCRELLLERRPVFTSLELSTQPRYWFSAITDIYFYISMNLFPRSSGFI